MAKKSSIPLVVVVVIIAIAVVSLMMYSNKGSFEPVAVGKKAPQFSLPNLDGAMINLDAFRGKVVFLNFWATWCVPCEEEMPSMQHLYESLKGEEFEMLAVSIDTTGVEIVREFVRKYGITFPVLHDKDGSVKEEYQTTGVPETFIIDQNGVIAEKIWGPRDWSRTASIRGIQELLRKGSIDSGEDQTNKSPYP